MCERRYMFEVYAILPLEEGEDCHPVVRKGFSAKNAEQAEQALMREIPEASAAWAISRTDTYAALEQMGVRI